MCSSASTDSEAHGLIWKSRIMMSVHSSARSAASGAAQGTGGWFVGSRGGPGQQTRPGQGRLGWIRGAACAQREACSGSWYMLCATMYASYCWSVASGRMMPDLKRCIGRELPCSPIAFSTSSRR